MNRILQKGLAILALMVCVLTLNAQTSKKIYYFEIDDNIAKPALRKTEKAVEAAKTSKADILFLRLNTFGGELDAADKIRTLLLDAPMTTMVLIDNNAASAGALISIACDSIYMAAGGSIGAASVVNGEGEIMPDKYQSYMRSLMRTTAEKQGRNPSIAEAMVDPDIAVENVVAAGKVLTFTTQEAIEHGFCDGEANSMEAVLKTAGVSNYNVEKQELSALDKFIAFLINPIVSSILIMIIVGGIYFELQTPGIGFALIAAIIAALLYFAPHYLEGLAAHWEIILFVVGLVLLALEIFVIPGFGVAGVSGIILIVGSLVLSMIFNIGFDFGYAPSGAVGRSILWVMSALIIGFFFSLWLGKKILTAETRFGTLAFTKTLDKEAGYVSQDMQIADMVGKTGTAATILRPSGKVTIDGEIYDAVAAFGIIEKGTEIKAVRFENAQLVVIPAGAANN
ncbi:MAG: nodulation protein NfeD [Bacteroidales bacterium]|nr:nodulation protein NfeD [Bacteroidales bacterium]